MFVAEILFYHPMTMFHPKRAFQSDPGFMKDIKDPEVSSRCHEITLALLQICSVASRWPHAWEKKTERSTYHEDSTQAITLDLLHLEAGSWHL